MPFLILPQGMAIADSACSELGRRLCPYDDRPVCVATTTSHALWTTRTTEGIDGSFRNAHQGGTASFLVHPESNAFVVETDPLGTLPLWYAETDVGWLVSPEVKALAQFCPVRLRPDEELFLSGSRPPSWAPFDGTRRVPPGARIRVGGAGVKVEGRAYAFHVSRDDQDSDSLNPVHLGQALLELGSDCRDVDTALVSGGIDSSVACALARLHGPIRALSLGTRYCDEFQDARGLAGGLDCEFEEISLDEGALGARLDRILYENEVFDGLTAEILLQLSALYDAGADRGSCAVTGYGSDLLFDGMLQHEGYMAAVNLDTTRELIERTRWTGELAPFIHWSQGLAVRHVFWNPEWMRLALHVARAQLEATDDPKRSLREASVCAGLLPIGLATRKKRGLSDGTGANQLFSDLVGLDDPYGYHMKSIECARRLRAIFESLTH
jgi:carbapenam-3-carboxylate synthase